MPNTRMTERVHTMEKRIVVLEEIMASLATSLAGFMANTEQNFEETTKRFEEIARLLNATKHFNSTKEPSNINSFHPSTDNQNEPPNSSSSQHPHQNNQTDNTTFETSNNTHNNYCECKEYTRKLEMSLFFGEDPYSWVFRAERYFLVNNLAEPQKLEAATVCFERGALSWMRFEKKKRKFLTWEELKNQILLRFPGRNSNILHQRFLSLKQEGTVQEYREQFETLSLPLNLEDDTVVVVFINGLEKKVKAEVILLNPNGLAETMDAAQRVEARALVLTNMNPWRHHSPKPVTNYPRQYVYSESSNSEPSPPNLCPLGHTSSLYVCTAI